MDRSAAPVGHHTDIGTRKGSLSLLFVELVL